MRILCGTIPAAAGALVAVANPSSESPARVTPDWFRKGVMFQIQPRAFTPEGTIKAAEGKLADFDVDGFRFAAAVFDRDGNALEIP